MKGHGEKLTRKQELALSALLSCGSLTNAAKTAGIGEKTLRLWLQDFDFKTRYREARQAVLQGTIAVLQTATTEAVAALQRNLTCGTPSVEVSAAKAILDQAFKGAELQDLAERVEEMEIEPTTARYALAATRAPTLLQTSNAARCRSARRRT